MLFSGWFRRAARPTTTYRPAVCLLEDRTVPVVIRQPPPVPLPPPATHLQVIAPQDVEAGKAFSVIVEALDAHNHRVTGFKGTVQITLAADDTGAKFPASFTFSTHDQGKHTIQLTLAATGAQTVKAASGSNVGQAALTVDGPVTHFGVYAATRALAGSPTMVTVVALDANNHTVAGYTGTVHLASTDFLGALPTDYTFQPADHGSHTFSLTFYNTGIHTLTVSNPFSGLIGGSVQLQVVMPWYYPINAYPSVYGIWGNPWY
jgi:hypothetical protein